MLKNWIWEQPSWPKFYWNELNVSQTLTRSRLAQGKILGLIQLFDQNLTLEATARILVEEGITTSAIEGEKLDWNSVRSSVARHLGLPYPKSPPPPRSVDGLIELLLDATQRFDLPLTQERLCGWQAALFPTGYSGLHPIQAGKLRGEEPMQVISGPIGHERVHYLAPPREILESELTSFLNWFNTSHNNLDGLIRAGLAHLWFVTLHPFEDGNGRLARAITDMAIAQDERQTMRLFSLSAQMLKERETYYNVLEKTQRDSLDVTNWLTWFLTQVEMACTNAEQLVRLTITKARFWLRFQNCDLNERQRKVMNRLLDAGPNGFEGNMNTRKYMNMTKTSRATAYRELTDLVEKGCLIPTGKGGRSSSYDLSWNDFG